MTKEESDQLGALEKALEVATTIEEADHLRGIIDDWYEDHGLERSMFDDLGILPVLADHSGNWFQAFGFAGETKNSYGCSPCNTGDPESALPNDQDISLAPFGRRDVASILGLAEGENDGADWLIAGQLKDGRWFSLRAGCDYTGWD